jgi:hypothetical protein
MGVPPIRDSTIVSNSRIKKIRRTGFLDVLLEKENQPSSAAACFLERKSEMAKGKYMTKHRKTARPSI